METRRKSATFALASPHGHVEETGHATVEMSAAGATVSIDLPGFADTVEIPREQFLQGTEVLEFVASEIRTQLPERDSPFVSELRTISDVALAQYGPGSDYEALASLVRLRGAHLELSGYQKNGESRDEAHQRRLLAVTDLAATVIALARLSGFDLGKVLEEKYK